jgi:hypothetical protein
MKAGNPQVLPIYELSCGWLQVLLVGDAYAEDNRQGVGPLFVRMAHDGGFHRAVQALHKAIVCRVVGGLPAELDTTYLRQSAQ